MLISNCLRSIVEKSTYENYEIVCVFDAETQPAILRDLREIAGDRLRLVRYDRAFSFSAKINVGVGRSEGEHLLLLNDDMEVVTPDWIERMVMYSSLPEVGAVGGRLLWEDGRLQHVGVRFENGLPGHPHRGFSGDFKGYANGVRVAQNCLAVTGACLMTRRELFEQVGGMTTVLPINYNDIDYCLKLRAAGLRAVYDPDVVMYHFESSSRSSDVDDWEKDVLRSRWLQVTAVDPYGNPNLSSDIPRLTSPFNWARGRRPRLPFRHRRRLRRVTEPNSAVISAARAVELGILCFGEHTYGEPGVMLYPGDTAKAAFGKYCSIGDDVELFVGGNHRTDWVTTYPLRVMLGLPGAYEDGHPATKGDIVVGNDVWIGAEARIMSGVEIGDGAVIGMGAIVAADVRPYAVAAGNPAREIPTALPGPGRRGIGEDRLVGLAARRRPRAGGRAQRPRCGGFRASLRRLRQLTPGIR